MVTLETEHLTLRMLRESDIDAYADMLADPQGLSPPATVLRRPRERRGTSPRPTVTAPNDRSRPASRSVVRE